METEPRLKSLNRQTGEAGYLLYWYWVNGPKVFSQHQKYHRLQ